MDTIGDYVLDSLQDLAQKVQLAHTYRVQGVYVWELGQDYFGSEAHAGGYYISQLWRMAQEKHPEEGEASQGEL